MADIGYWAVTVPVERYEAERLFHRDTLELPGQPRARAGDRVVLVAATQPPVAFGLGRIEATEPLVVAYTRRNLDAPPPTDVGGGEGLTPLDEQGFAAAAATLAPPKDRTGWLVSVDLPIEAESPAEAVRQFWTYVMELGPRELPAFVAPLGNELAMQAYVLGEETNLDPEEDED